MKTMSYCLAYNPRSKYGVYIISHWRQESVEHAALKSLGVKDLKRRLGALNLLEKEVGNTPEFIGMGMDGPFMQDAGSGGIKTSS